MFLKRLEIQGFKTFAARTDILFTSGITAIVGPNGSGKSNVADAVRWVLGEQSPRPLRIKRNEDVIFAGSSTRARLGMADVSITLDNSTGWLPVDFGEVTIARRAYRSGESEYLINKSRVRLRDVVDMLLAANIGQNAYTVIGQGAVDAALSLRPEERRSLFEEAADIKRFQLKRNEALNKLQSTDANLVRVRDIVAEIEPRLHHLQEQARRAEEHERVAQELKGYLAAWYIHRWEDVAQGLQRALNGEQAAADTLTEAESALQQLAESLATVRRREGEVRSTLSVWHRQASALHTQADALERAIAVSGARLDALDRQRQELLEEIGPLQAQAQARSQAVAEAQAEVDGVLAGQGERQAALATLEEEAAALQARRRERQARLAAAENEAFRAGAAIASAESALAGLGVRRQGTEAEQAQRTQQAGQHQAAIARVEGAAHAVQTDLAARAGESTALSAQLKESQNRLAGVQAEEADTLAALAKARDDRRALETRLDSLSRLHESMAGYNAGVRAVLAAARVGSLPGIVGTVASFLRVPPPYEAAIGAALGGHEQDIVVDSWQAAEAAVEHLRQTQSGRATFLPLDVIKGSEQRPDLRLEGVTGWAADHVQFPERCRPAVSYLLGRVLLVRDLPAARRVLNHAGLRAVASIATLGGDIVRPAGAVTGGSSTVRSSGLLERERELAELPQQVTAARAVEKALEEKRQAAEGRLRQARAQIVSLEGKLGALNHDRQELLAQLAQRQRECDRWQRELEWTQDQTRALAATLRDIAGQEASAVESLAGLRQEQQAALSLCAALRQELDAPEVGDLAARLAEARAAATLGSQELSTRQALLTGRRQEVERLAAQVAAKEKRAAELAEEVAVHSDESARTRAELAQVSAAIGALRGDIDPAEAEAATLDAQRASVQEQDVQARARVLALERAHSEAALQAQRTRDELARLQAQIEAEEGLGVKEYGLDEEDVRVLLERLALPLQLKLEMPDLPAATQEQPVAQAPRPSPEALKRRVDSLRSQLRHLGAVNPQAVQEYQEAIGRYTFLTSQSEDLDRAVKSLRTVIAELEEIMRRRFEQTFEAVAREFRRYFTLLFSGGTARLTLTEPDDLAETGVEIVAQPPGKRLQSLALLSGGERALTASALLFAILTVNPTPFCILDEVDAALDDANVGRFAQVLQQLAERTQFIIITHNRGTMEIASTLYGVSMGGDGASQVLSVKLDEVAEEQAAS